MITKLKLLCQHTFKLVYISIITLILCFYTLVGVNVYQYYQSDEYKQELLIKIYKDLSANTGQIMPPLKIIDSPIINAWTDGSNITFTTGILAVLDNEDEIAGVLAHEMAHNMLRHMWANNGLDQVDMEAHADKIGAFLLLRSGYDVCKARNFWDTLRHTEYGEQANIGDHPGYSFRYYALSMPWCR